MEVPTPKVLADSPAPYTPTTEPKMLYGAICGAAVNLEEGTRRIVKACPHCGRQTYISVDIGEHPVAELKACDPVPCNCCGGLSRTSDPSKKLSRSMQHAIAAQASNPKGKA